MDLIEIARIKRALDRRESFGRRLMTPAEYDRYLSLAQSQRPAYAAGLFAAKEAYAKALGTGLGRLKLRDIEVQKEPGGSWTIKERGQASPALLDIAYSKTQALAVVLLP